MFIFRFKVNIVKTLEVVAYKWMLMVAIFYYLKIWDPCNCILKAPCCKIQINAIYGKFQNNQPITLTALIKSYPMKLTAIVAFADLRESLNIIFMVTIAVSCTINNFTSNLLNICCKQSAVKVFITSIAENIRKQCLQ